MGFPWNRPSFQLWLWEIMATPMGPWGPCWKVSYHQPSGKWIPPFHDFGKPLRKVLAATWRNSSTRHLDSSMRRRKGVFCVGFWRSEKVERMDWIHLWGFSRYLMVNMQGLDVDLPKPRSHKATKTRCDCRDVPAENQNCPPLDGPSQLNLPHFWVNYNDLTATSLESWLVREIIPKWPRKKLVALFQVSELLYWIYPDILAVINQNICAETLAGNEPNKNGPDDLKIRPLDTTDTSPHSKQPWNGGAKSTFWTNSEAVETAKQLIVGRCSKVYAQKGIDMKQMEVRRITYSWCMKMNRHGLCRLWYLFWLVGWNMNFMTFHSVGNVIIPADFHSFFRGVGLNHQPAICQ